MKKLLTIFMFALIFGIGLQQSTQAADGDIPLYPYDQIACLEATDDCLNTKVGNSHWSYSYYGHEYFVIRNLVRYASEFNDVDSDGFIDDGDMAGIPYNAFGSVTINNTDEEFIIRTSADRTDITDVVHRKYAHFDENGVLQMFEDHVSSYYIFNDGTVLAPDWRLATQAEADAFDAADPKPETTRHTGIRMALDAVDTDGYVLEPLGWIKWSNADVDLDVDPVADWSTIIDDNPNNIVLPVGWTVISFGTHDRGTANPKTTAFILTLPQAMIDATVDPMVLEYTEIPGTFGSTIVAQDDDATTEGVMMVADFREDYDLPDTIVATWMNMFDDTTDAIIHSTEEIDYSATISQDDVDLETIDYVWNAVTEEYDASAAPTVIDTFDFLAEYKVVYSATTPEGELLEVEVDILVGVLLPIFAGVLDRYINEDTAVELMLGITADDGYGNSATDTVVVTKPADLNIYFPQPGEYQIDLEFTHSIHYDGISASYLLNGTSFDFDGSTDVSFDSLATIVAVYTDPAALQANTYGWSSSGVLIEVDVAGNVVRTLNRHNWDLADINGFVTDGDPAGLIWTDWLADLVIPEGGFVLFIGRSTGASYTAAQALRYGDPVSYDTSPPPPIDLDIVTNASYILSVDDTTNPFALAVNDDYTITVGDFDNVNEAILSNVVAFDAYDELEDLAVYVSANGGLLVDTAGTYTVEVTVEDEAGNIATVEFDVTVVAAPVILTAAEVQALIDASTRTDAEMQALIDASIRTDAEIQALIDAAEVTDAEIQALIDAAAITDAEIQALIDTTILEQTGCGSAINIGSSLVALVALGGGFVLFLKRKF